MNTYDEMLAIILCAKQGIAIKCRMHFNERYEPGEWQTWDPEWSFDFAHFEYRMDDRK